MESSDTIKNEFNKVIFSSESKKFSEYAKISDGDHQFTKLLHSDESSEMGRDYDSHDSQEDDIDDWEGLNDEIVEKMLADKPSLSNKTEIFEGKVV